MPYDEGVPPHAKQLGEPSSLFREPTQSFLVQVSFVVKDAGESDEGTHLVEVGSFFVTRGVALFVCLS